MEALKLTVEIDREDDGRWMADVPEVSGAHAYGDTREKAAHSALAIAFVALEGEQNEDPPFRRMSEAELNEALEEGEQSGIAPEGVIERVLQRALGR
jgi:predicted RNase H-like HicB family nuclease